MDPTIATPLYGPIAAWFSALETAVLGPALATATLGLAGLLAVTASIYIGFYIARMGLSGAGSVPELVERLLILGALSIVAVSASFFTDQVVDGLRVAQQIVFDILKPGALATPGDDQAAAVASLYAQLDASYADAMREVRYAGGRLQEAAEGDAGAGTLWGRTATLYTIAAWGATFPMGFVAILSEFVLVLVLAIGPVYLLALALPAVAEAFDEWVSLVLKLAFTSTFNIIAGTLMLRVFSAFATQAGLEAGPNPWLAGTTLMFAGLGVGFGVVIVTWAAWKAGGAFTSAGSRPFSGALYAGGRKIGLAVPAR